MIRKVGEQDRDAWVDLNLAFFEEENEGAEDPRVFPGEPREHFAHAFDALVKREDCELLLWEEDEPLAFITLVAFANVWSGGLAVLIDDLYVLPEARRRGIAGALMEAAEAFAARVSAGRIQLLVEPHNTAKKLYARHGYTGLPMEFMMKYVEEPK